MKSSNLKEKVNKLPNNPGVYFFKDKSAQIIYIGKAKNLKNRVGSYFKASYEDSSKTHALVQSIYDISFIEVESEFEALILEAELIKKHKPYYNIQLKDDKSYMYIVIRRERIDLEANYRIIPKIEVVHKTDIRKNDISFGPYPKGRVVKNFVKSLRKIFPFRDCSKSKFNKYKKLGQPCLYGHINVCPAPCINYTFQDLKIYRSRINEIKKVLSGESLKLTRDFQKKMEKYAQDQKYEKAAYYRDILQKFNYVRKNFRSPEEYLENPYLLDEIGERAVKKLSSDLPIIDNPPKRIECYDISDIGGKQAAGSMVVAINGRIKNSEYKRFKVRIKDTPDDFDMMYEVLSRRLKNKTWGKPDLVVLDGGKGQISAVLEVMKELNYFVPLIGLTKKEETIIYKAGGKFKELKLSKDNPGLKLLIKLRDEAHRFAQSYHHFLRSRSIKI